VIDARHITKSFPRVKALDDVSLHVDEGIFAVILGPSGAGKSTLFRTIVGLTVPDSGAISIDGTTLNGDRRQLRRLRSMIAPVFQKYHLVSRLSAMSNVLIGQLPFTPGWRSIVHSFSAQEKEWAGQCLHRVGLGDKMYQRSDTLSGGEQQRVAIARGLAQRAKVFYADEPIASLDPELGHQILDLLKTINAEERVTVVCNLHQVELAKEFSDTMTGLRDGRVQFQRRTKDVSEEEIHMLYNRR
jgi:phosphonate transport system ATP-binding protein